LPVLCTGRLAAHGCNASVRTRGLLLRAALGTPRRMLMMGFGMFMLLFEQCITLPISSSWTSLLCLLVLQRYYLTVSKMISKQGSLFS